MTEYLAGVVLLATILSCYCATASAVNTTYRRDGKVILVIRPDHTTQCPSAECYTIDELIDMQIGVSPAVYWLEIHFLPGRHIISKNISSRIPKLLVTNKRITTLSGIKYLMNSEVEDVVPVIEYIGHNVMFTQFEFNNIHILKISELTFQNTGDVGIDFYSPHFYMHDCVIIEISNISTIGTSIMAENSDTFFIGNSHFSPDCKITLQKIKNEAVLKDIICSTLFFVKVPWVVFKGNVYIKDGKRQVLSTKRSTVAFYYNSVTVITNNTYITESRDSSIIYVLKMSPLVFYENSTVRIENNTASGCSGIRLEDDSFLSFYSNSTLLFSGNKGGANGGALAFYRQSSLQFYPGSATIKFINNRAGGRGGAIFVDDSGYLTNDLPVSPLTICEGQATPNLYFINNTAKEAGDEIFGGWIDWPFNDSFINTAVNKLLYQCDMKALFSDLPNSDLSTVSSNPIRVCICNNATPNCNITRHNVTLYPGQTLELEAVAVGQRYGTVPSTIIADFLDSSIGKFERGQNIQSVGRYCTSLRYTVMSSNPEETIHLHPDNVFTVPNLKVKCDGLTCSLNDREKKRIHSEFQELKILFSNFTISVTLLDCPLGYLLVRGKCTCHPTLLNNRLTCNTNDYSIDRPQRKWINATFQHIVNGSDYGILVHNNCPFDYCFNKDTTVNLESPQDQCDFNRSDILCGACQNNFSHVLGTSRCKKCSNLWVLLIVPTVILAGIALVAFLMILDLTVSIGTINGLIFYANIVRANQAVFFPTREANTFLNVFIAWLNFDLGVETCFYDGLNAYTKTWLQFIFPFYIWLLVSLIIISSHYSSTVSRWSGSNAVQVLATLFLLSYVKLLRLIITVFLNTTITYPDGYTKRVWLYDGNVYFLKGEHIPLFIAALLTLVILTVPYTTTLTTIQWLQRHKSCKRALFWVHKFKPIFDAHTGPYKSKHRYWTGLLLLVRVALLLVFTINLSGDPSVNLLAITVTILCLSMYFQFIGGPYRSKMINLVEISFYFNACILSTTTIYRLKIESSSTAVTTISTSIAFVIFTLIVLYHAVERFTETRRGAKLKHSIMERATALAKQSAPVINIITGQGGPVGTMSEVSHSSIELKEPLLANVVQVKQD